MQTVGDVVTAINRWAGNYRQCERHRRRHPADRHQRRTGTTTVAEGGSTTAADLHLLQTPPRRKAAIPARHKDQRHDDEVLNLVATDTFEDLETEINNVGMSA